MYESAQAMRAVIALFGSRTIYWWHRVDAIRKSASDVAKIDLAKLTDLVVNGSAEAKKTNFLIGTVLGCSWVTFAKIFASWGTIDAEIEVELRHVRYIIAAAELRSLRCAADDLCFQQSAISRRIRDVEEG